MDQNTNTTVDELKKAFDAAPAQVKHLIETDRIQAFLKETQSEFEFGQEASVQLSNEILLLVLGLADPDELIENILDIEDFPPENAIPFIQKLQTNVIAKLKTSPDGQLTASKTPDTEPSHLLESGHDPISTSPKAESRPKSSIDPYREPLE